MQPHRGRCKGLFLLLLLIYLVPPLHGSFLFAEPHTYTPFAPVPLKVTKITSIRTELPYPYYTLPFCSPSDPHPKKDRGLAEILRGDYPEDSLYEIRALETVDCRVINYLHNVNDSNSCTEYNSDALEQFITHIKLNYTVHWSLDSLPAAVPNLRLYNDAKAEKKYTIGFPLGDLRDGGAWIYNHVDINIVYRNASHPEDGIVILGFEVAPRSQWYNPKIWTESEEDDGPKTLGECPPALYERQSLILQKPLPGEDGEPERFKTIFWTYSVHWEQDTNITWDSRWKATLRDNDAQQIHLVSIMNALIVVLFLMLPVVSILKRTLFDEALHPHGTRHTHRPHHDEDDSRWRMLGVEALRAPTFPMVVSVLLGSGVQTIGMMTIVILFGLCGFLLPVEQGTFTVPVVGLFLCMGLFAGFVSVHTYKIFRGVHRIKTAVVTAVALPSLWFGFFLASVLAHHSAKTSAALPYWEFAKLVMLWFGISVPLVFIGSSLGHLKRVADTRIHTSQMIRTVQRKMWYQSSLVSMLFAGVLPFGVVVIEYFFILFAFWDKPIYDSFRYLVVSILALFITSASTNMVACFYQLNSGDPHWWYRPFMHAAASSVYMMIYSTIILFTNFQLVMTTSYVLYFSFALFCSTVFFLLNSTAGFAACYFFVQIIYRHM